jgi:pullulanase
MKKSLRFLLGNTIILFITSLLLITGCAENITFDQGGNPTGQLSVQVTDNSEGLLEGYRVTATHDTLETVTVSSQDTSMTLTLETGTWQIAICGLGSDNNVLCEENYPVTVESGTISLAVILTVETGFFSIRTLIDQATAWCDEGPGKFVRTVVTASRSGFEPVTVISDNPDDETVISGLVGGEWTFDVTVEGDKYDDSYVKQEGEYITYLQGSGSGIAIPGELKKGTVALYQVQVTPVRFSPDGGFVLSGSSVDLTCDTPGAVIYYTTNGSEPSQDSTLYTGPVNIPNTMQVRAIAVKSGTQPSIQGRRTFTTDEVNPAPQFSPVGGTYNYDIDVTLTGSLAGSTIHYTTDGSTPNGSSTLYTGPIPIHEHGTDMTIKAVAKSSGGSLSLVTTASYAIRYPQVATPLALPESGTYFNDFDMTASCATTAAKLYYTTDGSDPDSGDILYGSAVTIDKIQQVNIIGTKEGYRDSNTTTMNYTLKVATPQVTPLPGTYSDSVQVSITCITRDATFYYTVDGSTPTTGSMLYSGPFTLTRTTTVKLIGVKQGYENSDPVTATYTVSSENGITIHFEKPSSWTDAWIWYDRDSDETWETTVLATPPGDMTEYRTGWFKKYVENTDSVTFLFNDGTWNNKIQDGGADFVTTEDIWITENGQKYTDDPIGPQPPQVWASPAGGLFTGESTTVELRVTGDDITGSRYTIDGSDPAVDGTDYSDGDQIEIGSDLEIDESITVRLYAVNSLGADTEEYTFTKSDMEPGTMLGAAYSPTETNFSIWSPDSSNVGLDLAGSWHTMSPRPDVDGYTSVYEVTVSGDHKGKEYTFKINGNSVRDPYAVMCKPGTVTGIVMDLDATDPTGGWASRPALEAREDAVIYEVHIRDFSFCDTSGVDGNKRGKYPGMVQTGTTYNGVATGIDHLKELGVTHVQILPFYDFSTQQYNWGYDPLNYNVPEEQYNTCGWYDYEERIREVKTMIDELHKNGIRVIMDVVYNHTIDENVFMPITSKYYIYEEDGTLANASGCGNGIDTGNPMVSRFIRDSLEYWVSEYNIDGFRFDLMGIFHADAVADWGEHLNGRYPDRMIMMHGEPWNGFWGDANSDQKAFPSARPQLADGKVGIFGGAYREGIKGGCDDARGGFMFNWTGLDGSKGSLEDVIIGLEGSIMETQHKNRLAGDWNYQSAYDPEQSINYISAHDNFCLWDKIRITLADSYVADLWEESGNIKKVYSVNYNPINDGNAKKINKFGMAAVLTSQGIPFIHAGDDILRTKEDGGDWSATRNSYDKDDRFNKIRWNWKVDNADILAFYKEMIDLRADHPAFRMRTWSDIHDHVDVSEIGTTGVIESRIDGSAVGDSWSDIICVYNPGSDYSYSLPSGTWHVAVAGENTDVGGTAVSGSYTCPGIGLTIFFK